MQCSRFKASVVYQEKYSSVGRVFLKIIHSGVSKLRVVVLLLLGVPPETKSAVFLNIVQTAVDPPPLVFEHCGADFF